MRHNIPLNLISLNWTSKYVSVKGQIVVKTCQSESLKYIKYQDIESGVEDQMEKWQSKKLIATTVSSRETVQRRRDEGKITKSQIHTRTQGNPGSDRCTSEGGVKHKLKQVDGDFPACMRRENNNNKDKKRRNEDLKGKGGGRLNHCNVDGDVPLCLRSFDEENISGSSVSNSMKNDRRSKMTSGSKDLCGNTAEKKKPRKLKSKKQRHHFHRVAKKHEIHTLKWKNRGNDMQARRLQVACNINERNVEARQVRNLGDTPKTHMFMGAGKYDNKHGVGIMLNRKWRQKYIDAEYINERVITATIVVKHQRTELMSVYFLHSGDADHHVEKCTEQSRSTRQPTTIAYRLLEEISMLSWDQDAELNVQVLANTHSTEETREVIGWNIGWCFKNFYSTQHDVQKESWETNDLQIYQREMRSKSTTSQSREDTWNTTKMPKPTTWSAWAVTTDVSWQHSWSLLRRRMVIVKI